MRIDPSADTRLPDTEPDAPRRDPTRSPAERLLGWAAWLVWITVLGGSLTSLAAGGLPPWWALPIVLVAVGATA